MKKKKKKMTESMNIFPVVEYYSVNTLRLLQISGDINLHANFRAKLGFLHGVTQD